jgi:very-short-patch-repair endonuclease
MNPPIHNIPQLKENRKALRKNLTPAEAALWKMIKSGQLDGRKFRRQHSAGNYILDFYCPSEKLAIELDGAHHFTSNGFENDAERTAFLNSLNIRVIRFENKLVFEQAEYVLEEIRGYFKIG